ncbi:MAG: hypothetical protein ACR2P8_02255 [Myxococcota bacterium]
MLQIHVDGSRGAFAPGETRSDTLQWLADAPPGSVELRLLWYTEGRGDQDVGVARTLRVESPAAVGSAPFEFEAPTGPYSCTGRLLLIRWALEATLERGDDVARVELVLAPGGRAVDLVEAQAGGPAF